MVGMLYMEFSDGGGENPIHFLLFIVVFSRVMVAGPIIRAAEFHAATRQSEAVRRRASRISGCNFVLMRIVQKMAIADPGFWRWSIQVR